jgi:hypothetical protein
MLTQHTFILKENFFLGGEGGTFGSVLLDFRHSAPNYAKTPYQENPQSQTLWIKDPICITIQLKIQNPT